MRQNNIWRHPNSHTLSLLKDIERTIIIVIIATIDGRKMMMIFHRLSQKNSAGSLRWWYLFGWLLKPSLWFNLYWQNEAKCEGKTCTIGLVVKSNVAIVGPPVRFWDSAFLPLSMIYYAENIFCMTTNSSFTNIFWRIINRLTLLFNLKHSYYYYINVKKWKLSPTAFQSTVQFVFVKWKILIISKVMMENINNEEI